MYQTSRLKEVDLQPRSADGGGGRRCGGRPAGHALLLLPREAAAGYEGPWIASRPKIIPGNELMKFADELFGYASRTFQNKYLLDLCKVLFRFDESQ